MTPLAVENDRFWLWVASSGIVLLLLWPAVINGGPLLFLDSHGYYDQGRQVAEEVLRITAGMFDQQAMQTDAIPSGTEGTVPSEIQRSVTAVRSVAYSLFIYVASTSPIGIWGGILAQSALIVTLLRLFAGRHVLVTRPRDTLLVSLLCIAATTLPWYVSYLMPDILAAAVILSGMIVVRGLERLNIWAKLFVFAASSFAMLSHYGHIPLGFGVSAVVVAVLLLQRRLTITAVIIAMAPLGISIAGNIAVNKIAFHEEGVATKRLPILLARSLVDGPARWHLDENCASEGYAICEIFDKMPDRLSDILWSDTSLMKNASDEQLTRIRAEESIILRRAFAQYPAQQTRSFIGNAVTQVWTFGMDDFRWQKATSGPDGTIDLSINPEQVRDGLVPISSLHLLVVISAIGLIGTFAWRDRLKVGPREREVLFVAVAGLLINAAIFGGLSVPVDRYQGRIIWILPILAALFWLQRRATGQSIVPQPLDTHR